MRWCGPTVAPPPARSQVRHALAVSPRYSNRNFSKVPEGTNREHRMATSDAPFVVCGPVGVHSLAAAKPMERGSRRGVPPLQVMPHGTLVSAMGNRRRDMLRYLNCNRNGKE